MNEKLIPKVHVAHDDDEPNLFCDASELRFPPGVWPDSVVVQTPEGWMGGPAQCLTFIRTAGHRTRIGDLVFVDYTVANSAIVLRIYND